MRIWALSGSFSLTSFNDISIINVFSFPFFPFPFSSVRVPSFRFHFLSFFLLARLFDYPVRIINQKAFLNVSFRNCLSRLINDACWTSARPPFLLSRVSWLLLGVLPSSLLNDKFPFILISQNKSQSLMFLLRGDGRSCRFERKVPLVKFHLQIERKVASN